MARLVCLSGLIVALAVPSGASVAQDMPSPAPEGQMLRQEGDDAESSSAAQAFPLQAEDSGLPSDVEAALVAAHIPASALSALVLEPDGTARLAYQTGSVREVGSVMKLVTTLFALEQLGPAFRFQTEMLAERAPGAHAGWQLAVRGGGDPGLRYQDLLHMLRELQQRGVDEIVSPVRVDARRFADEPALASGIRLDPGRVSGTLPWALSVDFSAVDITLPANGPGPLLVDPPIAMRYMAAAGARSAKVCGADWPEALTLVASGEPSVPGAADRALKKRRSDEIPTERAALVLQGDWPADCAAAHLLRSPLPPPAFFEAELNAAWHALGHAARLQTEAGAAPSYASVQVLHASRPLAELVHDANKFSNNQLARTLLLDVAAEAGELPARVADGERHVRDWLARHGLDFQELHLENGAGLSHAEVLTAEHLGALLRLGLDVPASPEFVASLSIPGQDGTLKSRFIEVPESARLRLKSGSLDGVRALAGYYLGGSKGVRIAVFIINDPSADQASPVFESLLKRLVE